MAAATPRRRVLMLGAAGVVSAATGCAVYGDEDPPAADDGPDGEPEPEAADDEPEAADDEPEAADDEPEAADDESGGGDVVATTSEVEVGGGLILADDEVVITQPSAGEFKGFSAICTHQGCTVSSISDGTINCPCHGSRYSIEDGSVVQAATGLTPESQNPLPEVDVTVDGTDISVA